MSYNELNLKMCQMLMELSKCEREIEIKRRVLSDFIGNDSFLIFKKLDFEKNNYISSQNILDFMYQKNINIFIEEANCIILLYDINHDGVLSYDEFRNLIQSKNQESINLKRFNNNISDEINNSIEFSFCNLMKKEIILVRVMMKYLEYFKKFEYDLQQIYYNMISINDNCITKESIKNYLDKYNISYFESDVNFIFNLLDISKDGKIDLIDFQTFFGLSNYYDNYPNIICPFYEKKNRNVCLLDNNEYYHHNLEEETICNNDNAVFNKRVNNIREDKLSKSLGLRISPERIYSPINLHSSYDNNANLEKEKEKISNSLTLRLGPERKYAPIEVEIENIPKESEIKREIENKNIYNLNIYFRELIDGEMEIESYKIDLALKEDFNCEDFFRLFEFEGQGYITSEDLNYGLNLLNLKSNEQTIKLLMKRFDLLKENKLNYGDFFDMIVSFQRSYRNLIEKRIPLSKNPENILDSIDKRTISCFKVLMLSIIEFEYRINNIRKKLNLDENKIKELFDIIDINNKGFLVYDDLIKYLLNENINYNNQLGYDLLFIRFDKGRNGKIFFKDFLEEFKIVYI